MEAVVKQELLNDVPHSSPRRKGAISAVPPDSVIALDTSSSDSESESESDSEEENGKDDAVLGRVLKKRRLNEMGVIMPVLDPLPSPEEEEEELPRMLPAPAVSGAGRGMLSVNYCKQFWKAGEFELVPCGDADSSAGGMDHVRIHPKFLHSNATSHKWALGAFAELLDNAIDEVCTGATYVKVDMLENQKDGSRMLLIEDNGGGMNPDKIRDCMSLGFSTKSKIANTIGQYGNGFKTSTMRLGADVIVFSRCCGKDGKSATQSIGLLSYTFLRSTGKEDTVVPMVHCKQASGMVLSLYSKKKLCYSASIHLLRNHILSLPKHRDSSSKKPKKKLEFPRHKLAYNYFGAAILYPPELVHR